MSLLMLNPIILFVYAASIVGVTASTGNAPSICMNLPVATLSAGQSIIASVQNPQGRPCVATLVFSDNDFLPLTVEFPPIACLGYQQAEFSIPLEVPNGDVGILWNCAGGEVESCLSASIIEGLADVDALVLEQTGFVECLVLSATLTTLTTLTSFLTTEVDAIVTALFSTSTVIANFLTISTTIQGTATQTTQDTTQESTRSTSSSSTQYTTLEDMGSVSSSSIQSTTTGSTTISANSLFATGSGVSIIPVFADGTLLGSVVELPPATTHISGCSCSQTNLLEINSLSSNIFS